jgi:hypothetical protein
MVSDSGQRLSAGVSNAGNGVSHIDPHLTTAKLEVHEAIAGLESLKLDPTLTQDEALRADRVSTMDNMEKETDQTPLYASEGWAAGVANNDGANLAGGGGDSAPTIFSEDSVLLGYPRTLKQAENYWRMAGLSNNARMRTYTYFCLERTIAQLPAPIGGQEIWFLHHANDDHFIYTGAVARHRDGLISTTKGGAKVVKAMVISQIVTRFESRMCGYATHFLKLLAEEMDNRKGEERIAFSVVYSGPNTDFFHKRG